MHIAKAHCIYADDRLECAGALCRRSQCLCYSSALNGQTGRLWPDPPHLMEMTKDITKKSGKA